MIGHLRGTIIDKQSGFLIIETGGVGYRVAISDYTETALAQQNTVALVALHTHLAVRENALDLYGFAGKEELHFFELLIGVSGIGPKSALAILSLATPQMLRQSITQGDSVYLTKVSGIGKKTAAKVLLELKDKLDTVDTGENLDLQEETDAVEALKSLGYSVAEARSALKKIDQKLVGTGTRVKAALQILGSQDHHA